MQAATLLAYLEKFQELKISRWEQLEDSVQMSNRLGSPTEDWIIPPDEDLIKQILEEDPEYVELRKNITEKIPLVKAEAAKAGLDTHHELDWLKFTDPLLGTSALEDAIECLKKIIREYDKKHVS